MATGIARAAFDFAHRLLARTRAVRRADRDASGDPVHHRRHGHGDRGVASADVEVRRDARQRRRNTLVSSHAKRFAADTAMKTATEAVQVYGGYGFIRSTPWRSCSATPRSCSSNEGTSQIQRLVIARETLLPRRVEEARRGRRRGKRSPSSALSRAAPDIDWQVSAVARVGGGAHGLNGSAARAVCGDDAAGANFTSTR